MSPMKVKRSACEWEPRLPVSSSNEQTEQKHYFRSPIQTHVCMLAASFGENTSLSGVQCHWIWSTSLGSAYGRWVLHQIFTVKVTDLTGDVIQYSALAGKLAVNIKYSKHRKANLLFVSLVCSALQLYLLLKMAAKTLGEERLKVIYQLSVELVEQPAEGHFVELCQIAMHCWGDDISSSVMTHSCCLLHTFETRAL